MNVKHGPIRIVRCKLYAVPDLPDICEVSPWCDPFICGELPLCMKIVEQWAIIHHMKISHGPTAVCSQIRELKQRLKMFCFHDQSANPFPILSLNRTASRKKRVYKGRYHSPPPLSPVHPCPSIKCYEALPGSAMTGWSFEWDNPSPRYWEHLSPTPFPSSLLQKVSL